jgi:leucyl/phenylalanyl-tRNA--protein transferase
MRRILPNRTPQFPPATEIPVDAEGLAFIGGSLTPETLLEAYQKGLFPWDWRKPFPWYSPDPRFVVPTDAMRASANLRKLVRQGRYVVTYDTAFTEVIDGCGTVARRENLGTWITPHLYLVYGKLFQRGLAHSVEVRRASDGALVGGLWGLMHGAIFFGESMFARESNASKVGFYDLCTRLNAAGVPWVDCQAESLHLRSLGAVGVPRAAYLARLPELWRAPVTWTDVLAAPGATGREG